MLSQQKTEIPEPIDDTTFYMVVALVIIPFLFIFLYLLKGFFKIKRRVNIDDKHLIVKPILSPALSILFPGFGQIYNRETDRGVIYIILTISTWLVIYFTSTLRGNFDPLSIYTPIVYFFIKILLISFLIFVYINSVIDAYSTAVTINRKILGIMRQNKTDLMDMMKLGRGLYNKQCYKDAVELYTAIITIYPTHALAYYNRAVVYYKLHNYEKAGIDFISAAKLGHKKAQRILKAEGIKKGLEFI